MVREGERRRDCRPGSASFSQGRFSCRGNGLFQCCRGLSSCREGSPPDFRRKSRKSGASCGLHCRDAGRLFSLDTRKVLAALRRAFFYLGVCAGVFSSVAVVFARAGSWFRARFPGPFQFETRCVSDPAARCFAEKRCFQSGPGGVAAAPRVFPFQRRNALEQFQFEMLCISNHTACRFAEKAQFFRSLWAGRRCAAASRFTFFKVETL